MPNLDSDFPFTVNYSQMQYLQLKSYLGKQTPIYWYISLIPTMSGTGPWPMPGTENAILLSHTGGRNPFS